MMATDNPSQVAADCGTVVQRRASRDKSERREALRATRFDASDLASQQRICRELQEQAFRDTPDWPLGQYRQPAAFRRELQGFIRAPVPLAWGVRRG